MDTENISYEKAMDTENISYEKLVGNMRNAFLAGKSRNLKFREQQLKRLLDLVNENLALFESALHKDMRKPATEVFLSETGLLQRDIRHTLANLKKWAKPTVIPKHLYMLSDRMSVNHDPFGVVLIIAPWNYIHLVLSPLVGAIAAGNCAILKPSEVSTNCEALIADLIPKYMDNECYKVVTGGTAEITALLKEKFDYIFYTGSFMIGKIIHAAANTYLTPVTLELGGKCPVFVDDSVDFHMTAQRIMWSKFANLGQTCVAPDFIMCTKAVEERLLEEFKKVLKHFYGDNLQESKDLARIINSRHWNRLKTLLKRSKGTVAIGGDLDEYDLWISPTVIVDVEPTDSLMEGELFGPLLPIVTMNSAKQAISFINERDTPLALYVYTSKSNVVKLFKDNTRSGALDINDCIYHCSVFELPFGGVGESGIGRYHGKFSFDTFSYDRAFLHRRFGPTILNKLCIDPRYPPYNTSNNAYLRATLKHYEKCYIDFFKYLPHFVCFLFGMALAISVAYIILNNKNTSWCK